jgi:hypothetical protein
MSNRRLNRKVAAPDTVRRADVPEIKSVDELSAFGRKLFKLAEAIPPDQLLSEEEIEQEIVRRRGGVATLGK